MWGDEVGTEKDESLEIDANRYRWLRKQHWDRSVVSVVTEPKENVKLGSYCPSGDQLDNFIDVAMGINGNT